MNEASIRAFFALWPTPTVRKELGKVARGLPEDIGRRVRPENYHITLLFLGNVEPPLLEQLKQKAGAVSTAPCTLELTRSGWWRNSKVFWVAPENPIPDPLFDLAEQLKNCARACELPVSETTFRPHVTLLRKAARPPGAREFKPIHWPVEEFSLVQSITRSEGPVYKILERWPLRG